MIADKQKGHKPAKVAEPEDTNVIDLMSALRASLAGKATAAGGKSKAAAPAAKSPAKAPAAAKPKARKAS